MLHSSLNSFFIIQIRYVVKINSKQSAKWLEKSVPIFTHLWIRKHKLNERDFKSLIILKYKSSISRRFLAGVCCGPCSSSKWEADIWGWLEVRRSAMLHYTVNQRLHWARRQYGHCVGTRGWLGVETCQLWLQDRDSMPNWYTINHPTTLHTQWNPVTHCCSPMTLWTPSHLRVSPVWPYCWQGQCGRCFTVHSRPSDLKSSSNISLQFAWITGPATDLCFSIFLYSMAQ